MQPNNNKRFYSPQFSEKAVVSIRRLAWALGVSMPKTIDLLVDEISLIFSSSIVCPKCIDKTKCKICGFHQPATALNAVSEKTAVSAGRAVFLWKYLHNISSHRLFLLLGF